MNIRLDHLPEAKRRDLERIVKILFDEFDEATKDRGKSHRRLGRILKIVLFGSYARGDWVDDPVGGYRSDYDILVVVNHDDLADPVEYWGQADETLAREVEVSKHISAPVNFIIHSLGDVNRQLGRGRPFFVDIVRDGIALFEAEGHAFNAPKPLSPEAALGEARKYFAEWFESAEGFFDTATYALGKGRPKEAAFQFHQAVERSYHCVLLVRTLYSPKSHRLNVLRSQAERLDPSLIEAWPRDTRFARRCFELLRRAYVDARYSEHYEISAEELAWLSARVIALQSLVKASCGAWLSELDLKSVPKP